MKEAANAPRVLLVEWEGAFYRTRPFTEAFTEAFSLPAALVPV